MAETVYNVAKAEFARADIDWENGDIRCALLTGSLTIEPDHATVAAVIAANTEASDASYGRVAAGTQTVTQDDTNDRANCDFATVDFGALDNETPTAMLVYLHVTNDSDSVPISLHDSNFGSPANGAGYTVTTPNDVLRLT